MATTHSVFVNLPIENLKRSVDFFTKLGFTFNAQFTSEDTTCMVLSDKGFVMLLEKARFRTFTKKAIVDTATHVEALIALSVDSREAVDAMVDAAIAHGGAAANEPQDHGFMYTRAFFDPDGHTWEVVWMDPAAVQG